MKNTQYLPLMKFIEIVSTNMNIIQSSLFQLEHDSLKYDAQCRGNECTHEGIIRIFISYHYY